MMTRTSVAKISPLAHTEAEISSVEVSYDNKLPMLVINFMLSVYADHKINMLWGSGRKEGLFSSAYWLIISLYSSKTMSNVSKTPNCCSSKLRLWLRQWRLKNWKIRSNSRARVIDVRSI